MDTLSTFSGFPQASLQVLANLAARPDRVWFEAHRNEYQTFLAFPCSGVCSDVRSVHCKRSLFRTRARSKGSRSVSRSTMCEDNIYASRTRSRLSCLIPSDTITAQDKDERNKYTKEFDLGRKSYYEEGKCAGSNDQNRCAQSN
jgi:hypothetical protein